MAVMPRTFELTTPLKDQQGNQLLLFRAMQAREELGRLPQFNISSLSTRVDINPKELLGKKVTVKMELRTGGFREFNGHVTRFGQGGAVGRLHQYQMTVRPWLWFLTRTTNCRIFQKKSTPDILKDVLTDKEFRDVAAFSDGDPLAALVEKSKCPEREYCVQYRETDFNFVSRLMEEEGIYYFFVHEDGEAKLKLVDSLSIHKTLDQKATIPFFTQRTDTRSDDEFIRTWTFAQHIQPGFVTLDDFDFKNPKADLIVTTGESQDHDHANHVVFDYPGKYVNPDRVSLEKILENGDHYVTARVNELHTDFDRAEAECNVREAAVGRLFTLTNAPRPDQERQYLIVAASYQMLATAFETTPTETATYDCRMKVLSSSQQFRPARVTPEPRMNGPQTAVVVTHRDEGTNKDDDITCDEFGRVKVRFHWDREHKGKNDENASCFIRVAHPWAGAKWGAIFLPRKGQEVVVDFLEGDPDQPIIIGSVYNADQMPPYDLPANKSQSGIKTRSTKDGGPSNFNEIRFEDKKGHEELVFHAERNLSTSVEADESRSVGNDRSVTIGRNETEHIKGFQKVTIDKTQSLQVLEAARHWYVATLHHRVDKGEDRVIWEKSRENVIGPQHLVVQGDRRERVDATESFQAGQIQIEVRENYGLSAGTEIHVKSDSVVISGVKDLTIKVGGSFVKLDSSGVNVVGPFIKMNCDGVTASRGGPITTVSPEVAS
jgi:type VI secretion system secreted protein VgrG